MIYTTIIIASIVACLAVGAIVVHEFWRLT
jgi:hypothetical protein